MLAEQLIADVYIQLRDRFLIEVHSCVNSAVVCADPVIAGNPDYGAYLVPETAAWRNESTVRRPVVRHLIVYHHYLLV